MKICIITEGGKNIGLGHVSRCLGIAQAVKVSSRSSKVDFIVNGDAKAANFLKKQDLNPTIYDWLANRKRVLDVIGSYDIVITDSYLAPCDFYAQIMGRKKKSRPYSIAVDDYKRIHYDVDMVINASIYGDKINYRCVYLPNRRLLLGKDYIILRKDFWNVPAKTIKTKFKEVLVTFGGINRAMFVKEVISFLSARYPGLKFHTVTGSVSPVKFRAMMMSNDICISAGGQTLHELARIGVPTIGICFAENQRLNLQGWKANGFLEYIGWYDQRNIMRKLEAAISRLASHDERKKRYAIGRRYVDGKGASRIAGILLKM